MNYGAASSLCKYRTSELRPGTSPADAEQPGDVPRRERRSAPPPPPVSSGRQLTAARAGGRLSGGGPVMCGRLRACWLLCLRLVLGRGDRVLGWQTAGGGKAGPGDRAGGGGNNNNGTATKADGGYNTVPGTEQTMMIQRALCVLVVVTALVVVYFVVRTIRMRKINRKNRKYGILKTNLENMEMRPLDQEDDEEDDTLFDVHHSRR
ncbi:membrane protein FAM174A-like [Narcine bancroftii]|uniref:membrane protein FAM174A-like n=1 Tax=Narcine bancroftii TaxID=1343680 RepID=UPI0038319346